MGHIHDVMAGRLEAAPEAESVVDGDLRLSNRDLLERVNAVAKALLAQGILPGDRVAVLAPPSADFWISFLAVTSIGAIWLGLNPRYQRNEYAYLLEDAAPKLVLCRSPFDGRAYLQELQELGAAETRFWALGEAPLAAGDAFCATGATVPDAALAQARASLRAEAPAVIVYTSGTTGRPKGAILSHRAVVETARSNLAWMQTGVDCAICPAPINHVGALNNLCFTVFASGGRIVFFPRVDLKSLAALNARERPSYLVASPTAFAMLLANRDFNFEQVDFYKLIVFGGAATPVATLAEVAKTGARLVGVYGQTETTGMCTYTPPGAPLDVLAETIGRPIDGVEMRIADGARELPDGQVGEIQVRGVCVMTGYFNNAEATRETFSEDGWLRTGDLGIRRADGNFAFSGRLKEMFKSGGYNVYPVEVELAICGYIGVAQAAVVAVGHAVFQEVGHGFIMPKAGMAIEIAELKAFLKGRIADYKIPKSWTVLEVFPFLPNGKVDKRALAATLSG